MLTIGTFSHLSSVSVKALRHWHAQGILLPARTDPDTGYRYYSTHQLREAVLVKVLRGAGLPLVDIAAVLASSTTPEVEEHLARHRQHLEARRAEEDRALNLARRLIGHSGTRVRVEERSCPAQPFIAWVLPVGVSGRETPTGPLDRIPDRLASLGLSPTGPWWMSTREGAVEGSDEGDVEMLFSWPIPSPVPPERLEAGEESGVLPPRIELVCSWDVGQSADAEEQALVVAELSRVLAERGVDPEAAGFRQFMDVGRSRGALAVTLK